MSVLRTGNASHASMKVLQLTYLLQDTLGELGK